jgi:hypothetical protein
MFDLSEAGNDAEGSAERLSSELATTCAEAGLEIISLVAGITGRIRDFSSRNAESRYLNCRSSLESGQTLGLELPQPQVSAFPLWQLG